MKNPFRIWLLGIALAAFSGIGAKAPAIEARADAAAFSDSLIASPKREGEQSDQPSEETPQSDEQQPEESQPEAGASSEQPSEKACKVVIEKPSHGTIEVDLAEGDVGEIATITAKHDILYKIGFVAVNGVNLIEDEETAGKFSFALIEGDNVVTSSFIVDEELCGTLSTIVAEAGEKDWTNLFTMENVITIIKWVLDGGILIAVVRYFIKDKRLAEKVEKSVKDTTEKIVPEATKQAVLEDTKALIEPMFEQVVQDGALARQLMCIVVKSMVLMQQNTPEAKIAILDEFEKLKGIVDADSIESVKKYIEESVERHAKAWDETMARLQKISDDHAPSADAGEEAPKDNGTQI